MSAVEDWQAIARNDLPELQAFECADPVTSVYSRSRRQRVHPAPWELEVQSYLRSLKVRAEGLVLVGRDPNGIVAVAHLIPAPKLGGTLIAAVGRANRVRGQHVGDEALDECVSRVETEFVVARIDPRNAPSQRLFARNGFEKILLDGHYELWGRDLTH